MKKRYVSYTVWLILASLLYFFENNTGSRIVLACSFLLPFVPVIRCALFEKDAVSPQPKAISQTVRTFAFREEDDPGDVRAYLPGDPVNRIHWKLSAKRDELLVRGRADDKTQEEAVIYAAPEAVQPAADSVKKQICLIGLLAFLLSMILLVVIPSANQGIQALLNRLFDASEAVNSYAYDHFSVPDGQPVLLAAVLLSVMGLSLLGVMLLTGSRLLGLGLMAGSMLFQIYFGLAFPAWVNVPLFTLYILWFMRRPWSRIAV